MQQKEPDPSAAVASKPAAMPSRAEPSRRSILYSAAAASIGFVAVAVPFVAGLVTFFAPLQRRRSGSFVRVAALEDIPPDGVPRRFPVVSDRRDAWNLYPPEPVGAVFLRRTDPEAPPEAVTSVCPHLGCAVDYRAQLGRYQCPCHNSAWRVDGTRVNPTSSPSPRDLDDLEVEVRDGEVWVNYQQFRSGISEQVPA